ncbi:unannotated protein [freshwater metagenome]|uniref:Unannotated protein n=1 Tax=freshwater metagenome TaxID=449393 RepID=A0A6J7GAK5_9ZZZZ
MHEGARSFLVGEICRCQDGGAIGVANQLGNVLSVLLLRRQVVEDYVGTLAGNGDGCSTADAGVGTGNQGLTAGQPSGPAVRLLAVVGQGL